MRIQPNYRTLYIFRLWILKILKSSTYTQSLLHSIIKPHLIINHFTIGKQIQQEYSLYLQSYLSIVAKKNNFQTRNHFCINFESDENFK